MPKSETDIKTDNPSTKVMVALFAKDSYTTRIGVAALIILFLFFAYYLIGGYTSNCACGSGESYQNCSRCGRMNYSSPPYGHAHAHSHPQGNYSHQHQIQAPPPPSVGQSSIYQSGPYLNF